MSGTISLVRTIGGIPDDAAAAGNSYTVNLQDQATGTKGIVNNDTGETTVATTANIAASAPGVYTYNVTSLLIGNYTAHFHVNKGGVHTYFPIIFSIDAAVSVAAGLYLADIEKELAIRVGPFYEETVLSGTLGTMLISALQSSISNLVGLEDLYILRRGRKLDGTFVAGLPTGDRIRMVSSIAISTGTVTPDRNWVLAPQTDEVVEFHHLHPTRELRRAVLNGLKRCYFHDRSSLTFTTAAAERNLTAAASWITNPAQVRDLQTAYIGSIYPPIRVGWYRLFQKGGHVWVQAVRDPYPNSMYVHALRPANTYINAATSLTGPDDDYDVISGLNDLEYAASAAHVEAWRLFPARLMPAAQAGLQLSRKQVAQAFTAASRKNNRRHAERWQHEDSLGYIGPEFP